MSKNENLPGERLGHPLGTPASQSKEGHPLHGTPHSRHERSENVGQEGQSERLPSNQGPRPAHPGEFSGAIGFGHDDGQQTEPGAASQGPIEEDGSDDEGIS